MSEEDKYNAKYATEIANALSLGRVEGTKYILTEDSVGSITDLAIPYGCTSIDALIDELYETGRECPLRELSKLIFPGSMQDLSEPFALFGGPKEVVFCEGITKLTCSFDSNLDLKTVYLPSSLTEVDEDNFVYTAIEDVYFGGTEEQWNALDIKITSLNTSTYEEQEYTVHFNVKY